MRSERSEVEGFRHRGGPTWPGEEDEAEGEGRKRPEERLIRTLSPTSERFSAALVLSSVRFEIGSPEQSSGRRGPIRPPGRG